MRKFFLLALFLMASVVTFAAPGEGQHCTTAIPLGDNYSETISGPFPKYVWYTAWTFDLPLSVYFIPQNETDPKPEVEMDFKCPNEAIYSDSIICSLFCPNSGSGIQLDMPHKPALKTGQTDDGRFCYYLAIGKEYRDLLLQTGIDYNVQVFVKVTFKAPGIISIAPDDMFTNCMAAKFMHLGDTVHVKALDKDRHVVVPYVQWQEDSIRYVWNGTEPVTIAVGNECGYDPSNNADAHILDYVTLQPQDTLKMTSAEVQYYIHSDQVSSEAGMFFAKFYTTGTGVMKIERVPMAPPQGGATLLRYGTTVSVTASDLSALYAIPYTWDTATIFTTPTDHIFRMYIGTTHDFTPESTIASYQFKRSDTGHWLGLTTNEMKALWTQAVGQYLYVRFDCSAKTTITPNRWDVSSCMNWSEIKHPGATFPVARGSQGAVYYRFYYRDWKDGEMTFKWSNSSGTCPTYFGGNCSFPASTGTGVIDNRTITKNGTWTAPVDRVNSWAESVDEDGYLYIRFNPGNTGTMTISTTAPEEEDPAPVVYPAATVSVVCNGEPTPTGQAFTVSVSAEQTLNLYPGPAAEISSRTPIETWTQTPAQTHNMTLSTGVYTLIGENESIQIEVK